MNCFDNTLSLIHLHSLPYTYIYEASFNFHSNQLSWQAGSIVSIKKIKTQRFKVVKSLSQGHVTHQRQEKDWISVTHKGSVTLISFMKNEFSHHFMRL